MARTRQVRKLPGQFTATVDRYYAGVPADQACGACGCPASSHTVKTHKGVAASVSCLECPCRRWVDNWRKGDTQ